jgi:catechol 2,3-dioxygenase-like lactoylglutathione lyase family enzyme
MAMRRRIEDLVEGFVEGHLTREELVEQLASFAGGTPAPRPAVGTFRSIGLNHLAVTVGDLATSRDFYVRHLGMGVMGQGEGSCFLSAGANQFIALFSDGHPGIHHLCFSVADYEPARAMEAMGHAGLDGRRLHDRVFFADPDGVAIQISSAWGSYLGHLG